MLLLTGVRVLQEYERAVVFRFGRARKELATPGVNLLLPFGIDRMRVVDTRTRAIQIAPQEIITHDNISISVDAVVYASVASPAHAVLEVEEFMPATLQLAATTLRAVLGKMDMDEILGHRDAINTEVRGILDNAHRAVGRRDLGRRDQGHPAAQGDAARDGAPGRGRARAAGQGDRRRGRGAGGVEAGAGGRDDRACTRARCSCASIRRWSRSRARRRRRSCFRIPIDLGSGGAGSGITPAQIQSMMQSAVALAASQQATKTLADAQGSSRARSTATTAACRACPGASRPARRG